MELLLCIVAYTFEFAVGTIIGTGTSETLPQEW